MTSLEPAGAAVAPLSPDRVVCPDSMVRALVEAAARAAAWRGCDDLGHVPVLGRCAGVPEQTRRRAIVGEARTGAVPAGAAGRIDAEAVAAWMTRWYPAPAYPAVVLGSPHGAAVHLAALLGAAWLPTGFTVTVAWPGGAVDDWPGACAHGAAVTARLRAANPDVTVRQVHDPVRRGPLCGSTVDLHVRWRRLPAAYRAFLRRRLRPGGAALTVRDVRRWPVRDTGRGHSFQVGSPASGVGPAGYAPGSPVLHALLDAADGGRWTDPRAGTHLGYAETAGDPRLEAEVRRLAGADGHAVHRVLYPAAATLSAGVADLYRDWCRTLGRGGDRCVVETGRMLDPWQVLRAGAVPYWCEFPSRRDAGAAEEWLAGSAAFPSVTVLPQAPGTRCGTHADRAQWRAMAAFAGARPHLDTRALAGYPLLPLPTSHAARVLGERIPPLPSPPATMPVDRAVAGLQDAGRPFGLLVG